jgi:hypothetical protein
MKVCANCEQRKPQNAVKCPACNHTDEQIFKAMLGGTPMLSILIVLFGAFAIFRSCRIGFLVALPGNLRLAALIAVALGFSGVLFGALWSFGIRSRISAALVLIVGLLAFGVLQFV